MSFLIPQFTSGYSRGSQNVEPFPDPFCDYASTAMPSSLENALRWCIVPGTPIELADLSYKPIEEVAPGDMVLTRSGEHHSVLRTSCRHVEEEIVVLTFAGLGKYNSLRLTQNHNVFAIRGRGKKPSQLTLCCNAAEKIPAGDIQVGDYFVTPLPRRAPTRSCRFDGWLIGMYLAEGCGIRDDDRNMGTRFTLGADDARTGVLSKLLTVTTAAVGRQQKSTTPKTRSDIRLVSVNDPELAPWLAEHCPGLADSKRLSPECLAWKDETILRVIAGWLDGDGYSLITRGRFRGASGSTACRTLATQLLRLANCVGMTPALCERANSRGFAAGKEDSRECILKFGKADCVRLQPYSVKLTNAKATCDDFEPAGGGAITQFVQDGYVFRRVSGYALETYCGDVHNFEVATDHSYIAAGVCCSNCEYIMLANGVYRSAIDRVIAYFITDIEVDGTDRDGKDKYKDFLNDTLGIHALLRQVALDYITYGNFFASVVIPFRRNLSCPGCGFEAPLKKIYGNENFGFAWQNSEFKANCPFCKYTGKWTHIDRRTTEEDDIVVKRWNPHEIDLTWDPYTDSVGHIWKIPQYYKQYVRKGTLYHLERAPWEVVSAIQNNTHIQFSPDVIYHGKEDTLAGVLNKGWGISRILTNFRQAWYLQVLHRYNEAIGLDYIIPFRVITPEPRPGGAGGGGEATDPLFTADLGGFTGQVHSMLRQRRRDPTMWFALPFPVHYQALGAEASQMAPHELMDQAMDTLLSSVGVPVEFYKGSMSLQSAPAALRLMESNWSHLTHMLNGFLQWLVNKISIALSWEEVTVKLTKPSHSDDLNRQLAILQVMMGGQVSQTTALRRALGIEFEEEQRKMLDEQEYIAEASQEAQEALQASGMGDAMAAGQMGGPMDPAAAGGAPAAPGGAPPAGGAPAPGGAPPTPADAAAPMDPVTALLAQVPPGAEQGMTPPELESIAQTIAQQIFALPSSQRVSALRQLKTRSLTIHSLVKSLLESLDTQAESQGRQMGQMQAEQGQMGSMAPPPPMGGQGAPMM